MAFQVLNREPDRSVENVQSAANSFVDNIYKIQSLKQTADYYKIQAKNAETEVKKFEWEKKAKGIEYMAAGMKVPPEYRPAYFKAGFKSGVLDMDIIHDGTVDAQDFMKSISNRTEEEQADLQEKQASGELKQSTADLYKRVLQGQDGGSGMGNGLPVGSSFTGAGLTIPLNPKLSESEQATVGGAGNIENYVGQINGMLDKGVLDFDNEAMKLGLDTGNPYLAGQGEQGMLQSAQQSLKALIPFAKGGKQLTQQEAKRLDTLLNFQGKNKERVQRDLNAFVDEFNTMRDLALGGSNAAKFGANSPGANAVKEMVGKTGESQANKPRHTIEQIE